MEWILLFHRCTAACLYVSLPQIELNETLFLIPETSFSALGMITSMAEECGDATTKLPRALSLAVPVGCIAGLFFVSIKVNHFCSFINWRKGNSHLCNATRLGGHIRSTPRTGHPLHLSSSFRIAGRCIGPHATGAHNNPSLLYFDYGCCVANDVGICSR